MFLASYDYILVQHCDIPLYPVSATSVRVSLCKSSHIRIATQVLKQQRRYSLATQNHQDNWQLDMAIDGFQNSHNKRAKSHPNYRVKCVIKPVTKL